MIFTRPSHTMLLAGGILLLALFGAYQSGALRTAPDEVGSLAGEVEDGQPAEPPASETVIEAEHVEGWEDEPVIDDAEFFEQDSPGAITPDNTGEEVFDPSSEALDPAPAADDDW